MPFALVQVWWESESEPGWGVTQRPDGYSIHLSAEARERYLHRRAPSGRRKVPSYYAAPRGEPYLVELSAEDYAALRAHPDPDGMRVHAQPPEPFRLTEAWAAAQTSPGAAR